MSRGGERPRIDVDGGTSLFASSRKTKKVKIDGQVYDVAPEVEQRFAEWERAAARNRERHDEIMRAREAWKAALQDLQAREPGLPGIGEELARLDAEDAQRAPRQATNPFERFVD